MDALSCVESQINSSFAIPCINCTMYCVHSMSVLVKNFFSQNFTGVADVHIYWDHWKGIYGNTKMFTEGKVVDNSENGHGYMVTSLITDECDGTFLTKFLKQVVFLLLGICLSLLCLLLAPLNCPS